MRVTNIEVQATNETVTYKATFTFSKVPGNRLKRYKSYLTNIKNYIKKPKLLFTYWRSSNHTIWFTVPKQYIQKSNTYDAFFLLAVGLGFYFGEKKLFFSEIVSEEILNKLPQIKTYMDYGTTEDNVEVTYKIGKNFQEAKKNIAQFFTLGVDSFFTLLSQTSSKIQKNHLIYVDGFDVPLHHSKFLEKIHQRIKRVAKETETTPVFISTNLREISDDIIGWGQFHVIALAAVGMLLPFKKIFIPGETFDSPSWGLRTNVDSLLSTTQTVFKFSNHNIERHVTIAKLKKNPLFKTFIENVRTCWINVAEENPKYNCSKCQKCLRTQLSLIALGINQQPTFEKFSVKKLENISLNMHVYHEWQGLLKLLEKKFGNKSEITKATQKLLKSPLSQVPGAFKKINV